MQSFTSLPPLPFPSHPFPAPFAFTCSLSVPRNLLELHSSFLEASLSVLLVFVVCCLVEKFHTTTSQEPRKSKTRHTQGFPVKKRIPCCLFGASQATLCGHLSLHHWPFRYHCSLQTKPLTYLQKCTCLGSSAFQLLKEQNQRQWVSACLEAPLESLRGMSPKLLPANQARSKCKTVPT